MEKTYKVLIIRHGESEADLLNVHEGRADFNLTARGQKQAQAMASYVSTNFNVNKIYASPLKRAAQTAGFLSEATGIPIVFDEDLMEFNNGLLAGLSYQEANEKYPEVKDLPIDQSVYGQESKVEFRARADKVLGRILDGAEDGDVIAVVSHGGMINQLYRSILGLPVSMKNFFVTGDTGIHQWRLGGDGELKIVFSNYTKHTEDI